MAKPSYMQQRIQANVKSKKSQLIQGPTSRNLSHGNFCVPHGSLIEVIYDYPLMYILYRRRHMCVRCSWPPCSVNESPTIKENDKPSLVLERAKNDQQPFLIIQKRRLTPSQGPRQRVGNIVQLYLAQILTYQCLGYIPVIFVIE